VCYWIVCECKNLLNIYIVIECEIAKWRNCVCLVDFCVTKKTDGWEEAVNLIGSYIMYTTCVQIVYRILLLNICMRFCE